MTSVAITTVVEMFEMVHIIDGRVGKHSAERVRYVLVNCEIWSHFTYTLFCVLVKYLVIFHADPCNKSYIQCIQLKEQIVVSN